MVFAIAVSWNFLILLAFPQISAFSYRDSSCRPEDDPKSFAVESVLQDDDGCDALSGLALLQKSASALTKPSRFADMDIAESHLADKSRLDRSIHSAHKKATKKKTTTTTTTVTTTTTSDLTTTPTSTTMPGIQDFLVFSTSSPTDHHIWVYEMISGKMKWLVRGVGEHDGGIAFDSSLGLIYIAGQSTITRYELAIRDNELMMYDYQPVPVAINLDGSATAITVTDMSDVMYADPKSHTINKIYASTMWLISTGQIQVNDMEVVDYVEFYKENKQYGLPHEALVNENCTCYERGYIFQVYRDVGIPSGMETYTGSTLLWGNLVDGFKRGTVVEAETEPTPILVNGTNYTLPKPKPLTHAWDSIFGFYKRAATPFEEESALFLTLNGTLGVPPIAGDVTGALVAIPEATASFPIPESTVMAWDFKKPRGVVLYRGTDESVMVADETGVTLLSSQLIMEGASQFKLFSRPDVTGLLLVKREDEAIPVMVGRGENGKVGQ